MEKIKTAAAITGRAAGGAIETIQMMIWLLFMTKRILFIQVDCCCEYDANIFWLINASRRLTFIFCQGCGSGLI
jgi:hypothetical protein